jgi:phenylpropionate dioxygenase-like ring-hydroxylating dioxygenase large terminal subunit
VIPRQHYLDRDALKREVDCLFRGSFEFVALAPELANDGDFVCLDYYATSIVVQNFRGEIKAFENICTHRFNRIQADDWGNRPLICRYHGWRFDSEGCPVGAVARVEAKAAQSGQDLCLPRYRVERCGQFIFIARGDDGASLKNYLGPFYETLKFISLHIGPRHKFTNIEHAANWKLLVENVIDTSHCSVVHQESFVSFGFCRVPVEQTTIAGLHSSWHVPRVPTKREGARRRALEHLSNRNFVHDSFYHIYIFPNLFIASTEGVSFYVGQALPLEPDRTVLRVRYLEPALTLSDKHRHRQDVLNEQASASSLDIIAEDRPILEAIQKSMAKSSKPGVLLKGEPRIGSFFDGYARLMADRA